MRKTIGILSVLLVAQLVLAASMKLTGPDLTAVRPDTPLLAPGGEAVNHLTIEGPEDQKLMLARQGGNWLLPETGDFPADSGKVDRLLDRLRELKLGLPIATSEAARERFKVTDEVFERRVTIAGDNGLLATLYLGTAPGMRRVHARTGDDDGVYSVEFGVHEIPARTEEWEDKTVLQIPQGEVEKIMLKELTLSAVTDDAAASVTSDADGQSTVTTTWTSETLVDGETVNIRNADALAEKLAGLRIGAVLGSVVQPDYGLETPVLVVGLQRKGGEEIEYRLGKRDQEGDYVLKASSRPEYFRLPGFTAKALMQAAQREQLVTPAAGGDVGVDLLPETGESNPALSIDGSARDTTDAEAVQ